MSPETKKKATTKAKSASSADEKKTSKPKSPKAETATSKKATTLKKKSATSKGTTDATTVSASPSTKAAEAAVAKLKGIRIRLSAFDHSILDEASLKIVDTAMRSGAVVHGPTPLPTKIRRFTVNRSTFVHKDARDQFEMRTHRRLIDLTETTFKTVDALQNLSLPSGVDIEIRMG